MYSLNLGGFFVLFAQKMHFSLAYIAKKQYLCSLKLQGLFVMYSINDITEYTVLLIRKFAQRFGLTDRQAANYIERYGAMGLLRTHYDIMHTLSFEDNIESLTTYCHRKGGTLV